MATASGSGSCSGPSKNNSGGDGKRDKKDPFGFLSLCRAKSFMKERKSGSNRNAGASAQPSFGTTQQLQQVGGQGSGATTTAADETARESFGDDVDLAAVPEAQLTQARNYVRSERARREGEEEEEKAMKRFIAEARLGGKRLFGAAEGAEEDGA